MSVDRNAIFARLEVIADSLQLADDDLASIAINDEALIKFASRNNQSIDWIVLGDVRPYIRRCAQMP